MSAAGDAVERLVTVVSRLQRIDLWPPTEAAQAIIDAVRTTVEVATEPPSPTPDALLSAAAGWRTWGQYWSQAQDDVTTTRTRTEPDGVWEGDAGDAFRRSMVDLARRFESVPQAASTAQRAFEDCAASMTKARARYQAGRDQVSQHLSISWSDLLPWQLVDHLRQIVEEIIAGINEMIGGYRDADVALTTCDRAVRSAVDQIDLPTHLAKGVPAVQQVSQFGGGEHDDRGPLRGSTAERADDAMAAMSESDRAAAQALLDGASGPEARAWILSAIASGLTGPVLSRYATKVDEMDAAQLAQLDPLAHEGTFTQPDATTCGSSSLVMARMMNDPAYAMSVITGYDPRTDQTSSTPDAAARFNQQALAMHDQTNGWTTHDGGFNGTWPEAWGTSPGSAARQMSGGDGLSGVPGSSYDVQYVDQADRARTYDAVLAAADDGHAVPIYTYDVDNAQGASGAHVTLVVGTDGDNLMVYEPGSGETRIVSRDEFTSASLAGDLGWDRPMAAVLPQ